MKFKNTASVFIFLFLCCIKVYSQTFSAVTNINPFPSPYTSDWEINPAALGSVTLFNNRNSEEVRLRVRIELINSGIVFTSVSNILFVPTLSALVVDNTKIISMNQATFPNSRLKNQVIQTGRLPEGEYTVCFDVVDLDNNLLLSNVCANFTIVYPEPPHLIYPANRDSLDGNNLYPVFQWTPVVVPPAYQLRYIIRICEILQGQSPLQALTSNVPHFEDNNIPVSTLVYPVSALSLEDGKRYVWQVQVLDQYNYPPAQNQGKSEIFTFSKKKSMPPFVQDPIELKTPDNNAAVKTNMPKFLWTFTPPAGINPKYNLRVVKVLPGQDLETAINNYPVLNQTILANSFQSTQPLSMNAEDTYAWQVTAINPQTNNILQKSEIRTFTLFHLILLNPNDNAVVNMKRPHFQWAHYGSSGKYYDLKVIKLPMFYYNQDDIIEESLFDDPQNIIFAKYNLDGSALSNVNASNLEIPVFKPNQDIPMEEAKSYYWQVSVKDQPFGNVDAKSEIRKIIFNPYQPGFATNCQVSGNLFYEFADPGEYVVWPLKNISIKLVVKYILKYTTYYDGNGKYYDIYGKHHSDPQGEIELQTVDLPLQYQFDNQKTVGVGKTDANGFFSFSLMNLKPMGVIDDNFQLSSGGGEFTCSYIGKLYRVIRLIVQSPYYTSPDTDIILQPGETKHYSQLIAYVRSYALKVTVKSPGTYWNNQFLSANTPINKMIVYLLRKNRPGEVPTNEGLPRPQDTTDKPLPSYEVIGRQISDANGNVTFKRLVKNVYSQNDEYWIWATIDTNQTSLLYQMLLPVKYTFKYPNDFAVYNSNYKYQNLSKDVVAFPLNPVVKGKVKRQDGGQPLANANVKLLKFALLWWQQEASIQTNGSGDFWFTNLQSIYNENGVPTGPIRALKISKYGFRDTTLVVKSGTILKPGESWRREILMEPDSKITGKIVDETGNGISAKVTVVGGESVNAIPPFLFTIPGYKRVPASFEVKAPKGVNKIIIDTKPYDASYLIFDTTINVTGSVKDLGTIVIKKALHRIKIFAGDITKKQGGSYHITSKLTGAKIKLETFDGKIIGEKLTDQSGYAEFIFANASLNYLVTVTAPADHDFEKVQKSIYNKESGNWSIYEIFLKPASRISGYVYVGTENQPVSGARVWLDYSNPAINVETNSDQTGFYELRNVPIGSNTVKASKKSSNLIGDQKNIIVPAGGLANINFNLKVYSDMDITHMLSFPIEVDNLVEQGGEVKITGSFVDLDQLENDYFKSNNPLLKFTNIAIEPHPTLTSVIFGKTVPVAKPQILPLKTDDNDLSLNIFNNFSGLLIDKNIGVELASDQTGTGVIKGKVFVSQSSFSIPSTNLNFTGSGFYIKVPNTNELRLPAITPDKSNPLTINYFNPVNENGGDIKYSVYGYSSDAELLNSFLYKDSVVLNTTIHTDIVGMSPSDLNLKLGNITVTPTEIKPLYNQTNKISYSLGQWNVDLTKWSFSGYLSASEGLLKTNTVDIPITSLLIKPTELTSASFNFSSMSLGGVVPLSVIGNPMFGYENVGKKWYLTVGKGSNLYSASFSGLPGMAVNDSIFIASFSLYSDGTKNFSPQSKNIKIYNVGNLSPDQLIAGDNLVEITSLTFNIPKVGQLGAAIQYYKENNQLKFKLLPVKIAFSVMDVDLAFAEDFNVYPEHLDEAGLRARGRVYEDGRYSLDAWLYHTIDSTSVWVETPNSPFTTSPPWQKINVGSATNYLDKIAGGMRVINNQWDTLRIAGDLITTSGIKQGENRLSFVVTGDWIASSQKIGIKNINTPFGGMSWTYNFEESRLIGSMNIDKDLGGIHINGPAETVVDGSGWYFFGGISMKIPGIPEAGAALIIGDYPSLPQSVKNGFSSVSYNKKLPCYFHNQIKGFMFSGHAAIPVFVPSIDVNAVVATIKFGVEAGADVRIWSGFDGSGNEYGIGALAYLHAYFKMSAITCTKLSADAKLELGFEGIYQTNPGTFTLSGCGGFSIGASVVQKGIGIGDFCTPPEITVFNESIGMHANIKLNSSGDISLGFGTGACSDQNSVPCN